MRLVVVTLALIAAGCAASESRSQGAPPHDSAASDPPSDTTVIEIRGPTLLAHFPVTQAEVDSNADVGEALDDFQYHLKGARESLARLGISIVERYTPTIHYRLNGQLVRFEPPADSGVAYVFLAPDRPPLTSYGVITDEDLVDLTRQFLASRRER